MSQCSRSKQSCVVVVVFMYSCKFPRYLSLMLFVYGKKQKTLSVMAFVFVQTKMLVTGGISIGQGQKTFVSDGIYPLS